LKEKLRQVHEDLQILVDWQTANLVLHALANFAWDYVSIPDRDEMKSYEMFDFLDLHFGRYGSFSPKKFVALRIYRNLPDSLRNHVECVMLSKASASFTRKRLAHPVISQDDLEIFLQHLPWQGDSTSNLDPLDAEIFRHLKTVSISEDNVKRALATRRA